MQTKDNCLSESKDDQPLTLSFLFFSIHFYFEGEILFNERERERKKEKEKKRSFVVQEKKNVILLALNSQINLILKRKKKGQINHKHEWNDYFENEIIFGGSKYKIFKLKVPK